MTHEFIGFISDVPRFMRDELDGSGPISKVPDKFEIKIQGKPEMREISRGPEGQGEMRSLQDLRDIFDKYGVKNVAFSRDETPIQIGENFVTTTFNNVIVPAVLRDANFNPNLEGFTEEYEQVRQELRDYYTANEKTGSGSSSEDISSIVTSARILGEMKHSMALDLVGFIGLDIAPGQRIFDGDRMGSMSEGSTRTEATDTSLAGGMPAPRTGETPKQKGIWGGIKRVFGIPDNNRHIKPVEAAKAVALGAAVGAVGGEAINNVSPVQSPNSNQAEVTEAPIIQPGGVDLTEKAPTPWIAPSATPPVGVETPDSVTPNPNLDPRAKALLDLSQEQRNLILTDTINVAYDSDLGELTFTKEGINYRFDPSKATEGNPEAGLVAIIGEATSADGTTQIFVESEWNTRDNDKTGSFKTLKVEDQQGLQALADMYSGLSAQVGKTGNKKVRFVISGEDIGTPDNVVPGWEVHFTTNDNKIGGAVKKGEVGNQTEIIVYIDTSGLKEENKIGWIYSRIVGAALEDASHSAWEKFDSEGVMGGEALAKYGVSEYRNSTFSAVK